MQHPVISVARQLPVPGLYSWTLWPWIPGLNFSAEMNQGYGPVVIRHAPATSYLHDGAAEAPAGKGVRNLRGWLLHTYLPVTLGLEQTCRISVVTEANRIKFNRILQGANFLAADATIDIHPS